jgi:phage tail-like protein
MRPSEIERFLPAVYQLALHPADPARVAPDRQMAAILAAMEVLHARDESILETLPEYFDPRRVQSEFVPFLAGWVDLDWLLTPEEPTLASGHGRLREIVARAAELAQWRGTSRGLRLFLETVTGIRGFIVEENVSRAAGGAPTPFHMTVAGPADATRFRPLIERVIRHEKPAHMTYELELA